MGDILILGAGLSGLSAAYHLSENNIYDWSVLEKTETVGGLCRSVNYDGGFTFDQSIHILYSSDRYATELIKKLLGTNLVIQNRESWVYSNHVYTPYPWQANTHGLPVHVIKDCLMGVIKATYERKSEQGPDNFEEWCRYTFGEGIAKYFMVPYNRKLWAVDLKNMTDAWIKDRVLTPRIEEVVEGAIHRQDREFGPNSVFWYPATGGIGELPKGFLSFIERKNILFKTSVQKICWKKKIIVTEKGLEMPYRKLISSIPLPNVVRSLEPMVSRDLVAAGGKLEHNTVYAINLAINRDHVSPHHWVYFPEEKYLLHRISFPKNFSRNMCPRGWSTITVEVSDSKYRNVAKGKKLINKVLEELTDSNVITRKDIVKVVSVMVLNPAYVIYNKTHRENVDKIHRFLKKNQIFPCGRFGEWEYLNMDHSILSGKKIVGEVMENQG